MNIEASPIWARSFVLLTIAYVKIKIFIYQQRLANSKDMALNFA